LSCRSFSGPRRHTELHEELVSRKFGLTEINDAMRALGAGEVARGIVVLN
jgi:Zn-dependent alcohol dehydrogenase